MCEEGGREGERKRNYIIHVGVCACINISVVRMLLKFHCFQIRKLCLPRIQPHPQ